MRILWCSCVAGAVLSLGISAGAWAQDQPAAGSPPPGATAAAPAQTQNTAPAQAQAPAEQNAVPAQNAAPAQNDALPPPPPDARRGPNPHRQARMMARKLGLTAEQEAAVEPILASRDKRMAEVRGNAALAPAMRRARVRRIGRESVREINALLTDAQKKEFKQMRQEQRAKRLQREQQMAAPAPAVNQ